MADLPIACRLTPEALQSRRADLLPGLLHRAQQIEALPDGYRIRFAASTEILTALAQTVDAERQCCPFLQFRITIEADNGPLWLELTGPLGTADFLASLFE